jgi:hypothetical protein
MTICGELLKGSIERCNERCNERIDGSVEVTIEPLDDRLFKVAVELVNESPCPDEIVRSDDDAILLRTFASTLTICACRAGDLFDSTEIDEILTLRIMTMTDDEKAEMRSVDDFARANRRDGSCLERPYRRNRISLTRV